MIIRSLFLDDVTMLRIAELGKHFYSLTGLAGNFKPETFATMWNQCMKMGLSATWISKTEGGNITGILGMSLSFGIMDGQTIAEEIFWFVDPEHRGRHGLQLFHEAERWAEDLGVKRMTMSSIENIKSDKLTTFYQRKGFRKLQTQYVRDSV